MRLDFEKQTRMMGNILNGEKVDFKLDRVFGMTIPGFLQYLKEEKEKAEKKIYEEIYDYVEDYDQENYDENKKICK